MFAVRRKQVFADEKHHEGLDRARSGLAPMNKDREGIEDQLPYKLPGNDGRSNVWDRLSQRDFMLNRATRPENFDGCPRPARFHAQAAEYSTLAMESAMIGSVPPIPAHAAELLSYHDPGGAATMTSLERLTLKMINNHEASDKAWGAEDRAQQNRHGNSRDRY